MKKARTVFVTAVLVLLLGSCSSGGQAVNSAETAEKLKEFAGTYLMVDMYDSKTAYTDYVQQSWEDKSFYEFLVIGEDGKLDMYKHENGKTENITGGKDYYLDPASMKVSSKNSLFKIQLKYEDGKLFMDSSGYTMIFEKTEEELK